MEKLIKQIIAAKKANLTTNQLELIDHNLDSSDCSFQELAKMLSTTINANEQDVYDYLINEKSQLRQYKHRIQ